MRECLAEATGVFFYVSVLAILSDQDVASVFKRLKLIADDRFPGIASITAFTLNLASPLGNYHEQHINQCILTILKA